MAKAHIDFGHGGTDSGAVSNGLVEKNMTLTTGLECRRVLMAHGVLVNLSRYTDETVSLSERVSMANNWGADIFVSIHYNAGGGDGVEAIHSIYNGVGQALAKKVVETINEETGQNLRPRATYSKIGADKKDYYFVIKHTRMDAIIVEGGFIDSNDRFAFDTVDEQKRFGVAIAHGILKHLGIAIKDSAVATNATVTATSLRIRANRGTQYGILGNLKQGDRVKCLYLLNGWWSIDVPLSVSPNGIGFVSAEFIKKD